MSYLLIYASAILTAVLNKICIIEIYTHKPKAPFRWDWFLGVEGDWLI